MSMIRVTINLDDELVKLIDDYAKSKFINRTSAISVLLSEGIQRNKINESVVGMGKSLDSIQNVFDVMKSLEKKVKDND